MKKLSDLTPAVYNPRKATDEAISELTNSMDEFGDLSGFVFNRRTGRLVSGHQRQKAIPSDSKIVIEKEFETPTPQKQTVALGYVLYQGEEFRYREVDWDEAKEIAGNIRANKAAGEFDLPKLAPLVLKLDELNYPLERTGYTLPEIEDIVAPFRDMPGDEDVVPAPPKAAKTKRGELWILGEHRLLIDDCTVKENVERLMAGEKADMVFTDPPYGMRLDTDFSAMMNGGNSHWKKHATSKAYEAVEGDFEDFDPAPILGLFGYCKEVFLWGADYYAGKIPPKNNGSWVVWDKRENEDVGNYSTENMDRRFGSQFELCWSKNKHRREIARILWTGLFGTQNEDIQRRQHPTQKPSRLAEWFFDRWGKDAKNIWDGYLGSGSTLIACEKTGRRCFGCEIEPIYCDVILDRWAKFTGRDPVREDGAKWSEVKDGT